MTAVARTPHGASRNLGQAWQESSSVAEEEIYVEIWVESCKHCQTNGGTHQNHHHTRHDVLALLSITLIGYHRHDYIAYT